MKVILDDLGLHRTVIRLSHEIEERCEGLENVVLVGVKQSGEIVAQRIGEYFRNSAGVTLPTAGIDIGTTREDLASAYTVPDAVKNDIPFPIDGKTVVLCDGVLHTGRGAAAAIEAIFRLGRPAKIRLLVLVDRGGRELPVRADFVGKNVPTSHEEYVGVRLRELGANEDCISLTRGGAE